MTNPKDKPEPYERREYPTVMDGLAIGSGAPNGTGDVYRATIRAADLLRGERRG